MSEWTTPHFRNAVAEASGDTTALLDLLAEEHPAYEQLSTAEVVRRRGWVLAALGRMPFSPQALPYVLEELQSGHTPYLLAAAARALRQCADPPAAAQPALIRARDALQRVDDFIDLDQWGGTTDADKADTGMDEIQRTLDWLATRPTSTTTDCCGLPLPWRRRRAMPGDIGTVRFEDQSARAHDWAALFTGKPSITAFFYTRCDNELKCSLTVCKLAEVQRLLEAEGLADKVRINAITYDPDYDLAPRLAGYAESRRLRPGEDCHLLRAVAGADDLAAHFNSGANFVGSIVNRHRIEAFVLDARGEIVATCQRLEWQPEDLVRQAKELLARPASMRRAAHATPVLWALGLALLPKCPICGVTYLSMSGIAAYSYLPGWSPYWPLLLVLLLLNVLALGWFAKGYHNWLPLAVSGIGAALIAVPGLALGIELAIVLGAGLIVGSSLLSVLAIRRRSMHHA